MANEDFTTYTEVDPSGTIERTPSTITVANFKRTEDAYVYDDKGVDHFDGDFEHLIDCEMTSRSGDWGSFFPWSISNIIDDIKGIQDASGDVLALYFLFRPSGPTQYELNLNELDGGSAYSDDYAISLGTQYWLKVKRDEEVGTYGTIYTYIYTDSDRTVLVTTLSIALHTSKKDYRYYFPMNSQNNTADTSRLISGYSQNHDLQEAIAFTPERSILPLIED